MTLIDLSSHRHARLPLEAAKRAEQRHQTWTPSLTLLRLKGSDQSGVSAVLQFKLFYLSLTNLSLKGSRGHLFMMSLSAASYAREMAGTYTRVM